MPPTPNRQVQRYRRTTSQDSSLTTGRVTNPVGSFVPNNVPYTTLGVPVRTTYTNPSTAADGQFGAPYGGSTKAGQVTPPPTPVYNVTPQANASQQTSTKAGQVTGTPPTTTYQPAYGPQGVTAGTRNATTLTPAQMGVDMNLVATDANYYNGLSTAQKAAVERLLGAPTATPVIPANPNPNPNAVNGGFVNTGGGTYADTAYAQYAAANNIAFENQMRWDPTTKKYVRIGTLLAQGKLDIRTGKDITQKKKQQQQNQPQQQSQQRRQNSGNTTGVTFNTAEG